MLCVTGLERDRASLAARVRWADEALGAQAALHEVRLDALARPGDDAVFDLLGALGPRAVVCCRRADDSGGFAGDEGARLELLERAARCGVGYVDLEHDVGDEALARVRRHGATRLVLSLHAASVPEDLEARARAMVAHEPDVLKIAVGVDDAAELAPLLRLAGELELPSILIGMGAAGTLSRCRYRHFGAPWTYVCSAAEQATAAGQLTVESALELGLPDAADAPFIALLGGAQIAASPGPRVYNRLFRRRGLPWSYLPVVSTRAEQAVALIRALGAFGASVTAPLKQDALSCARTRGAAARAGALNTLCFGDDEVVGLNTDVEGVVGPLGDALREQPLAGDARVQLLGAGGAARAVALACKALGLPLTVCARDVERARAVMGEAVTVVPWSARAEVDAPVLVNATTLGGDESPWPASRPLSKAMVFDLAIAARPSALLAQARTEGARVLDARAMWVHQGALQMQHIAGLDVAPDDLAALLDSSRSAPDTPVEAGVDASVADAAVVDGPPTHRARVPASKSMTQRALLIAALGARPARVRRWLRCDDSERLIAALRALGTTVAAEGEDLVVTPGPPRGPAEPIHCGNAGTTLRFVSCLALICEGELVVDGDAHMRRRPVGPLGDALSQLGVEVGYPGEPGFPPLRLRRHGPAGSQVSVDARLSSQFASGLLLVAPRLERGLRLRLLQPPVSAPYLEMTCEMMRRAGVAVERPARDLVVVAPGARYDDDADAAVIEPDWSSAAALLAGGALLDHPLEIDGLVAPERSLQGDAGFVALLAEMRADGAGERVVDLERTPDVIGPLAALALFAERPTRLAGIAHTRFKECDRPRVLARGLRALGAAVEEQPDAMLIHPLPRGGDSGGPAVTLDPEDDHRMAMAFGLISLRLPRVRVRDRRCVSKSFPRFWDELERLRVSAARWRSRR